MKNQLVISMFTQKLKQAQLKKIEEQLKRLIDLSNIDCLQNSKIITSTSSF